MRLTEKTAKNLHKEVYEYLKSKKYENYLDIGCGTGALINRLKNNTSKVFGTDLNKNEFNLKNVNFKEANLNKEFPFENQKFDLITAVEIIEHLENQFSFVRQASKRLKKGGTLVLTSPNVYNIWSKLLFVLNNRFMNFLDRDLGEHINPVIENILLNNAKKNGLMLVQKGYSQCHIPLTGMYLPLRSRLLSNVVIYVFKKIK